MTGIRPAHPTLAVVTPLDEVITPLDQVGNWLVPYCKVRCLTDFWTERKRRFPERFGKVPILGQTYTILAVHEHQSQPGWFGIQLVEIGFAPKYGQSDIFPVRSPYDISVEWFEPAGE